MIGNPVKIGYPCINHSVPCTANRTFRLGSYSEERFFTTVTENLACLEKILRYNEGHGILFFRISSDLIPFASHMVCTVEWKKKFLEHFRNLGKLIQNAGMRISMHPDQFVLINALNEEIVQRSIMELEYHAQVLDLLGLDTSAKIQIHVGGVYGDRNTSIRRFCDRFDDLTPKLRRRLVIENDDRSYTYQDCSLIAEMTGIPVVLDSFHHEVHHGRETLEDALALSVETWQDRDGIPMVDYSSQEPGKRRGTHAYHLDPAHFRKFLAKAGRFDFDLMLEIKEKEKAALSAMTIVSGIRRGSPSNTGARGVP